jgi:hypothetical protein
MAFYFLFLESFVLFARYFCIVYVLGACLYYVPTESLMQLSGSSVTPAPVKKNVNANCGCWPYLWAVHVGLLLECLVATIGCDPLMPRTNKLRWNLQANGKFSVYSMYRALIQPDALVYSNKKSWKMKILLKTKVFAWYIHRAVILTKDNLVKRNSHGNSNCIFCHHEETIKHLLF